MIILVQNAQRVCKEYRTQKRYLRRNEENHENFNENDCNRRYVYRGLKCLIHYDDSDAERRSGNAPDVCDGALRLCARHKEGNVLHAALHIAWNRRYSGIRWNDRRSVWLVGYTGGFIWGFIFLTLLCGLGVKQKNSVIGVVLGIAGLAICHLLGVIQFAIVASSPFTAAFVTVSVPYIIKDVISVVGAYLAAIPIRKALRAGNILNEEVRAAA